MKKIVLTAAVALFAFAANAQNATATSTLNANATLVEVIVLTPASQSGNPGGQVNNVFDAISEYDNGLALVEYPNVQPLSGTGTFEFTIAASCAYEVKYDCPAIFTWSGGASQTYDMPCSALKLQVSQAPANATNIQGGGSMFTVTSGGTTLFKHPQGHTTAAWGMDAHLTPGYGHQGGDYSLPITITAVTL